MWVAAAMCPSVSLWTFVVIELERGDADDVHAPRLHDDRDHPLQVR
jgi:hypothetical protein